MNSLLFKISLNELLDKSDFSVLDSFRSKSKGEQKIILEELNKYKNNNNQEIKGLEEHIKNLEEMFNKDWWHYDRISIDILCLILLSLPSFCMKKIKKQCYNKN